MDLGLARYRATLRPYKQGEQIMTTASQLMALILPHAPEAILTEDHRDGNISITLNLQLKDNDRLVPFDEDDEEED
jgi:uncharacterized protein (DUF927 family)